MIINLNKFDDAELLLVDVAMAGAELLGYGIHMVLFILAICILRRRKTAGKKLMLIYTAAMALFGTTQLVLSVAMAICTVQLVVQGGPTSSKWQLRKAILALDLAQTFVFFANNLVSDSLLLYRCFVIWGSRWRPIVLPGLLIVATCIVGYGTTFSEISHSAQAFDFIAPYIFAAVTNLVLVAFTGALYFFPTIILLMPTPAVPRAIFIGIAIHLLNIAPTLIVVRVGLGHDIQGTIHTIESNAANARLPAHVLVTPLQHPSSEVLHIKRSADDDSWAKTEI
ncbi:hypothetical protein B0H16DRAFT_1727377 [Mycena metata]|uniref:Uncharacterized protein n=1 Tax=Mycena metata TaxID=1033252 RepID=A0AAD7IK69_9AGAR|nr:hypothetical protein B0H16DRAFT_1727377 [Mycena metata]